MVEELERALGPIAHAALGFPCRQVSVSGITGTNGKTTIAALCRQSLNLLGRPAASLGTLGYEFGGQSTDFGLTTPPADIVAECVAQARDDGANELVMEVSSHALSQYRVDGVEFAVAGYSNLSQDHLDYHGTFEQYEQIKARLFEPERTQHAVLNVDDPHVESLARRLHTPFASRLLRVGSKHDCDLRLVTQRVTERATVFEVQYAQTAFAFETSLVGAHNVCNWLVVLGMLIARGVALADCQSVVAQVQAAPGRLERCDTAADDISVLVDYAHTPDALQRVLQACRALCSGQLWCVFGCGGDRDRGKRPLMGEVAASLADRVVITNDNPRTEAPELIAQDIQRGIGPASGGQALLVLDRRQAIEHALAEASPGDLVLIAGKGHETYQIFGRVKHDFDDRIVARSALRKRRTVRSGGS